MIGFNEQIGVDNRKLGAFFNKKQMRDTVIQLMVADGNNVGCQGVHNFNGRNSFVFGVND